jgi:A118 family predicted phage portal protein
MLWPPNVYGGLYNKMLEYSAWYSGDIEKLILFYTQVKRNDILTTSTFWGRQIKHRDILVHVPIANDIAEVSASLLFGEAPIVKLIEAETNPKLYSAMEDELNNILEQIIFMRKLLEAAETCAAISGVYIKLAWDKTLSPYPIPVIVQPDNAIPEFKFGILTSVIFWQNILVDNEKVYRLLEYYEPGIIKYELYQGSADRLGTKIPLNYLDETKDLPDVINTYINDILAVYIPNKLPNNYNRNSYLGRSDYAGIESLMDKLDEVFTSWAREITLAQPKILLPESFLQQTIEGEATFDYDQNLFVKLHIDPVSKTQNDVIIPQQFEIRADQYEKTALNLIERIIVSAGYSPQTFGLNIAGRAESGTALNMRERKSFITQSKKQTYWGPAINKLLKLFILVYKIHLQGTIDIDVTPNIEFSDSITNNLLDISQAVKVLNDAIAISTETKVRMIHPEWKDDQVQAEVQRIMDENNIGSNIQNPDIFQLGFMQQQDNNINQNNNDINNMQQDNNTQQFNG